MAARVVDPSYVLFWYDVAQAVDIVSVNNERQVVISVGNRTATVKIGNKTGKVLIQIGEYEAIQSTLIVPPGGTESDEADATD